MSAWNYPKAHIPATTEARNRTSITSLIISDDVIMRNALADAIATEGSGAVAIESVEDAVERLDHTSYPLIFAPQQLPGLSGSEICSRLRASTHGEHAWIVALPRLEVVSLRQLMNNGFDGMLRAPFEPSDIAVLIAGAARNARAGERLQDAQDRAETLRQLARDLAGSATPHDIADHLLEATTSILPNSAGAVWLKAGDGGAVTCAGIAGLSLEYPEHGQQLFSYFTPDRWLEIARRPMFVNAMSDAPRSFTDIARAEGYAASLTVALLTPSDAIGALVLYTREQTSPTAPDIELIETLAASASLAFDRVDAQEQIQALRSVIEHVPDGVFICDVDGSFLMVNPALEMLAGQPLADLEQRNLFELLEGGQGGEMAAEVRGRFRTLSESGFLPEHPWERSQPPMARIVRPDHSVLHAELHLNALQVQNRGDSILVQGVLHDVTEQERTGREFSALTATAAGTASAADSGQAVQAVVTTLREQAGYPQVAIWMMHPNEVELIVRHDGPQHAATIPLGEGPVGRAAATAEIVFQRGTHGQLSVVGQSPESRICVPVTRDGQVTGVIDVTGTAAMQLDERDVAFLKSMATHLAAAIERIHLNQELRRQATIDSVTGLENRETFLRRLEASIAATRNEPLSLLIVGVDRFKSINDTYGHLVADDMLKQVAETIKLRVRSPQAIARYTSDQFAIILPSTGRTNAPAIAENFRIGVATQLFMAAEQVEQMTVSVGAASYPNDAGSLDQLLLAASHAMYLAKQAGRNQVYQSNEAFAELAVAHGRITDLLRQSPRETLSLLVRAMDQRTPERAGHSQRVADYALALARTLGISEEDTPALRIAAIIHDIGMFSLPDSLLRKPAGLSDSERELLYSIPVNAHRLLSQIPLPPTVLPSVVHQHEHWDGSGFPSGLKGELIPPGSRIIAVADAIDAMTSERAHRQPLTMGEALDALADQAGQRFDPDVVRAARSLLGELHEVSLDRRAVDLETTLVEALEIIPPAERVPA